MKPRSEMSMELYEMMLDRGYPEEFCDLISKNLNTDFTATRMMGYLYRYSNPRLEDVADEMLAILDDRNRIMEKKELEEISEVCHKYDLPLYLDGARLGYGLVSPETDVTLEDIARYTDVFYIGGTKVGALCGEAVVFTKKAPKHFMTMVKQQGDLLV